MGFRTERSGRELPPKSMTRRRSRHTHIYYRNTIITVLLALAALLAVFFSPAGLVSYTWLLPLFYLNYVIWKLYFSTHPPRMRQPPFTPEDATLPYEEVSLTTGDDLQLTGWYIPGRNRAAVILVHGLGGSKVIMLNHARALAFDGYGVLLIDLRGHGGSGGDTITGVHEANDILAGLEYLESRPDVDANRIGALGVSLGALAVLRAARKSQALRALVLDGLGPTCLADHGSLQPKLRRKINRLINRVAYRLADWTCGERIGEGVLAALPMIAPRPVLLIASGSGHEIHFNRLFFAAARDPKELWEVPSAKHGAVLLQEPHAYRQKIRSFFGSALLGS